MSYNISDWRTKRLENLTVPLAAFYASERIEWHPSRPEITNPDVSAVVIRCGCEQEIRGTLEAGLLHVTEFEMYGEGSGTFFNEILEPALAQSRGKLEAVLIWEGGDSITRLTVTDGKVSQEGVEL